jgi:hypothetical protein
MHRENDQSAIGMTHVIAVVKSSMTAFPEVDALPMVRSCLTAQCLPDIRACRQPRRTCQKGRYRNCYEEKKANQAEVAALGRAAGSLLRGKVLLRERRRKTAL